MLPDNRQLNGRQRHNRELPPGEVLLVAERSVTGKKNVNPVVFGCPRQLAVLERSPAHPGDRHNLVRSYQVPQCVARIFVEQNLHLSGCPR
jgi:hypothetical protein